MADRNSMVASVVPDLLEEFVAALPGAHLVLTPDFTILAASREYLEATMTTRGRTVGRHLFDVFPDNPADPQADGVRNLARSLHRVLESGSPDRMGVQKYDIRRPESEGGGFEERFWSPLNSPVLADDGSVRFLIHTVEDVTDLMRLRWSTEQLEDEVQELEVRDQARIEALRASQDRFRRFAENLPDIVYRYRFADPRGYEYVSQAVTRVLGYTPEEFYADPDLGLKIVHPDDRRLMEAIRAGTSSASFQLRWITKDGRVIWTEPHVVYVRDEAGQLIAHEGIVRDVTEHRRFEAQRHQSQKMEAIGHLAGGVAHDFNNLLTVIIGYTATALAGLDEADDLAHKLGQVRDAADRAADLTRQLLAFSRLQVLQPKVLDPNERVEKILKLLDRLIPSNITIETMLASDVACFRADAAQIDQVLVNLAVNARDAMPSGGTLRIETANVDLDAGEARTKFLASANSGAYVLIRVTDTGVGMDEETRARVFEPFFTTKPAHSGTGLGLSTVYGIVKQSGGYIAIASTPGCGTTVEMYFPPTHEDIAEESSVQVLDSGGTESILVVEDDPAVRSIVTLMLERQGYSVCAVAGGSEALSVIERGTEPFSLLLTDLMLPEENGQSIARRVKQLQPNIRVVFMSGYTDDHELHTRGLGDDDSAFIQKPFTASQIGQVVRALIDR